LGYFEILAMQTSEIASYRGYGKGLRTGKKMEKGLFFDRIYMMRTGCAVNEAEQCAPFVCPDTADSLPAFIDDAVLPAEFAFNLVVFKFFVE